MRGEEAATYFRKEAVLLSLQTMIKCCPTFDTLEYLFQVRLLKFWCG